MSGPVAPAATTPVEVALPVPSVDPDGLRRYRAVRYDVSPGFRPVELDLVLPPAGPCPLVLFLHGGGWRSGDRREMGPRYRTDAVFGLLARRGVAVASVDYRLSGEVRWPGPVVDVAAALRWVRHRSNEIAVDPDRIAVWGESAGGHLAALLALAGPPLLERPAALRALVAWYAPSDLVGMPGDAGTDPADPATREALLLGAALSTQTEAARQASPISWASAAAPPVLLAHGAADRLVSVAQSDRFHRALLDVGVSSSYLRLDGADHLWLGAPDVAGQVLERTVAFLVQHLSATAEGAGSLADDIRDAVR